MEQSIFNWIAGGIIGAIGWFARMLWDRQEVHGKELEDAKTESAKAVAELRVLLAGNYVTNVRLGEVMASVRDDLKYIREKLDENPQRRHGDTRP